MEEFLKIILAGIISGAVISTVLGLFFKRKTETITAEIKNQFEMNLMKQKTSQGWKEKAIIELYGPLNFYFERTKMAFDRYHEKNLYLEAKVMKESNEKIRNLLLEKAYLIPPELGTEANELVRHYDVWLEEFYKLREVENPEDKQSTFVFVGPKGVPFPKKAEAKMKEKYKEIWGEVYGG